MGALPAHQRSGGRVVEGARLESEYTAKPYRGFESLPLRHSRPFALSDDPELAALAGSCVADDAELGLEPRQLAFLRLARFLGIPFLDRGFLFGLGAEVGNRDTVAEDLVAAQAQLCVGFLGQRVAYRGQPID